MTRFCTLRRLSRPGSADGRRLVHGLLCVVLGLGLWPKIAAAQPISPAPPKPKPALSPTPPRPAQPGAPRPAQPQGQPRPGGPAALAHPAGSVATPANQVLPRLITQATTAMEAQDYATAYRTFVQAYPLAPGILLYHLGLVAAAEQHNVEARDLWRRFLADPTVDAASPLRAEALQRLEQLPILEAGEVIIGAPRGSQVQLDGKLVGTVPLATPLLVQTGRHRVAVNQGRWTAETEVQVRTARQSEVRFKAGSDVAVVTLPSAVLYCDSAGLPVGVSEAMTQALETAVKRENFALLSRQSALGYARDLTACQSADSTACCEELARRYAIDYLLAVRLKQSGDDWQLEAQLRDMQVDDVAGSANPTCESCSVDKVALRLGEAATQLLSQAAGRSRGTLEVTSTPTGAEVYIGGRRLGVTPYQHALWTGTYQVELRQPRFRTQTQSIEVESDKPAQLAVTLEPGDRLPLVSSGGDPARKPNRRPIWRYAVGAATIGAGLLMVGFGAAGLATNGSCAVDNAPDGMCPRAYNTLGIGAGLVGAGGALAIGGAVLIALPPRR